MVRLLRESAVLIVSDVHGFNPTMVRLLPCLFVTTENLNGGFNPTMVRLLRDTRTCC